ncbi:hypothetical protein [Nostoc sp. NMS9]|uniref:hypothetical protein n=1 Tax=Nostoc sp. NMS9 TaxID=2815393 RepID=UPI0025E7C038|nr:hypothetical protein [Nostoc sp. NMS9]MBN3943009.1 hypothetical protein [Nostoc sp. NMS9]
MTTAHSTIAVTSSSPGITVTLESTGIFLGILVSASVLAGVCIKVVSSISRISSSIAQIEKDLKEHADMFIDLSLIFCDRLQYPIVCGKELYKLCHWIIQIVLQPKERKGFVLLPKH